MAVFCARRENVLVPVPLYRKFHESAQFCGMQWREAELAQVLVKREQHAINGRLERVRHRKRLRPHHMVVAPLCRRALAKRRAEIGRRFAVRLYRKQTPEQGIEHDG